MQSHNKSLFDMATAVKTVTQFGGEEEEDVDVWIRDLLLVSEVAGWGEVDTCKVAIISLKGKARSWASQVLGGKTDILTMNVLIELLKKRFGSSRMREVPLSKFCSLGVGTTREEYSEMLTQATSIHEKNIVARHALMEMVVHRSPSEIKGLLYQTALVASTWEEFIQKAEEVAGIAYPDKLLARVEGGKAQLQRGWREGRQEDRYGGAHGGGRGYNRRGQPQFYRRHFNRFEHQGPFCTLHGRGDHWSWECEDLTKLLEKERSKRGIRVASIEEERKQGEEARRGEERGRA